MTNTVTLNITKTDIKDGIARVKERNPQYDICYECPASLAAQRLFKTRTVTTSYGRIFAEYNGDPLTEDHAAFALFQGLFDLKLYNQLKPSKFKLTLVEKIKE